MCVFIVFLYFEFCIGDMMKSYKLFVYLACSSLLASCGGGQSTDTNDDPDENTNAFEQYIGEWWTDCSTFGDYFDVDEPGLSPAPLRAHFIISTTTIEYGLHIYENVDCAAELNENLDFLAALGIVTGFNRSLLSQEAFETDDGYAAIRIALEGSSQPSTVHLAVLDEYLYEVNYVEPRPADPADWQRIVNFNRQYSQE